MATKYTYSIQDDFPYHKVDPGRLTQEIQESAITTALDSIDTNGDDCNIWFKAALSSEGEAVLDSIVAAHSGDPLPVPVTPTTTDGKPLVTSNAMPEWVIVNICGRGDTSLGIGAGDVFQLSCDDPDTPAVLDFNFVDPVYMTSGTGIIQDAQLGDKARFEVFAPATVGEAAPLGDGNCNQVPTGAGFNIFVPAAGNGAWKLALDTADCHLVPNPTQTGFWDWEMPQTGPGRVTPNPTQTGAYDLFDIGIRISMFATDIPLLGTDVVVKYGIENVRAKMIPPHWHWLVTLFCGTAGHTVKMGWFLHLGRARSYLPQHIPMVP